MANISVLKTGHEDRVTAIDGNFYGKRLVTGSFDHKLKVFDIHDDKSIHEIDSWTAHDAHVLDVRFLDSVSQCRCNRTTRSNGFIPTTGSTWYQSATT